MECSIDERQIDVNEVGRLYGASPRTIWVWLKAGKIPAPVVNRKNYTRWLYSDILKAIRTRETKRRGSRPRNTKAIAPRWRCGRATFNSDHEFHSRNRPSLVRLAASNAFCTNGARKCVVVPVANTLPSAPINQ